MWVRFGHPSFKTVNLVILMSPAELLNSTEPY